MRHASCEIWNFVVCRGAFARSGADPLARDFLD
jgi:hypothetical protein